MPHSEKENIIICPYFFWVFWFARIFTRTIAGGDSGDGVR
jgi:hypothetical protein